MANAVDKEQLEMLSGWWNDYGKGILIAVIIGLGIGFGWRYWVHHKEAYHAKASAQYQVLFNVLAMKNMPQVKTTLKTLKFDYSDTPYASLGAMLVARTDIESKDTKAAQAQYQWVIQHGKVKSFQQIARLRDARILLADKQYDQALTMLKTVNDKTFDPAIASLKGDIYFAKGDKVKAKAWYDSASAGYRNLGLQNPFIDLKVNS